MPLFQMQGPVCVTRLKDLRCDDPYALASLKEHYCPAPFGAMPEQRSFDPFNQSKRFPDLLGPRQVALDESSAAEAAPRTSARLERLEQAKAKLQANQLDLNALDEFVNFTTARKAMDESIAGFNSAQGSAADYAAQAARAGKDFMLELGESAYEAVKAVPKLGRMVFTNKGRAIAWLDAQIMAENIRLGNTTVSSAGEVAIAIGAAMVKPVTEPWGQGQYVEALTRGALEVVTSPTKATRGLKAAQEVKVGKALELEDAAKAAKVKAALDAEKAAKVDVGIPTKPPIAKNGYFYHTDSMGRVTKVEGDLTLNKNQGRSSKAQLEAGGVNRLPDDQGGHFIGRRFNGPTDEINHFAQNGNFNQGAYKTLENSWEKALNNGQSVRVQVNTTYIGDSLRPDTLTVRHWLDGIPQNTRIFNNMPGGIVPKP